MVDNVFDFTLARQALEKLIDTTPPVAYTITAEPQGRKHPKTAADAFKSHAVFAITDVFEADISISANLKDPDFPFDSLEDMRECISPARTSWTPSSLHVERQSGDRALLHG